MSSLMRATVVRSLVDRLVDIQVALMDFQVKSTARICADPSLISNCCALCAVIRKWNEFALGTLATFWPCCYYHQIFSSFYSPPWRLSWAAARSAEMAPMRSYFMLLR